MNEDILSVTAPPEPEPILSKAGVNFDDKSNVTMEIKDEPKVETESDDEDDRPLIPDEEIFPDAPKVKKVKRQASEKQLAHLKKMREAKEKKAEERREWEAEQRARQKKIVKAERKKEKKQPKKPKKVRLPSPISSSEDEQVVEHQQNYPEIFHKLTASEIRAIQRDAIADYEGMRELKIHQQRQRHQQQQEEKQMRQALAQQSQPDNDPWASAFNFS
jgi:hypothetical protein